jgi:hypothetical protein
MRAIAAELQKRKLPTPRGGVWHSQMVIRLKSASPAAWRLRKGVV